jgi:hypothetical protein
MADPTKSAEIVEFPKLQRETPESTPILIRNEKPLFCDVDVCMSDADVVKEYPRERIKGIYPVDKNTCVLLPDKPADAQSMIILLSRHGLIMRFWSELAPEEIVDRSNGAYEGKIKGWSPPQKERLVIVAYLAAKETTEVKGPDRTDNMVGPQPELAALAS